MPREPFPRFRFDPSYPRDATTAFADFFPPTAADATATLLKRGGDGGKEEGEGRGWRRYRSRVRRRTRGATQRGTRNVGSEVRTGAPAAHAGEKCTPEGRRAWGKGGIREFGTYTAVAFTIFGIGS